MKLIIKLLTTTLSILIVDYLMPSVSIDNLTTAFIVVIVLGVLNFFVKPLLVVLTLPVTVITLGLFYFVINAAIVLLAANLVPGFYIEGWISALLFSVLVSLINSFLQLISK